MRDLLQRIDDVLCRVPTDSVSGRRVRDEVLDHLADAAAERVAAGEDLATALGGAADDFGRPESLERDYYRDYLASRYWLGILDRELLRRLDRFFVGGGAVLLSVGLLLYLLIPTVSSYAAAMGVQATVFSGMYSSAAEAPGALQEATSHALHLGLPWPLGSGAFGILAGIGLLLFSAGGVRVLRREKLLGGSRGRGLGPAALIFLALPLVAAGFVLASRPEAYGTALEASLFFDVDHAAAADELEQSWWSGLVLLGLLALAAAAVQFRAMAIGRGDTYELRRAAFGLLLLSLGVLAASHPALLGLLRDQSRGDVAPAAIVSALHADLHWFVLGVLLIVAGLHALWRVADDVMSTSCSRAWQRAELEEAQA